MDLFTGFVVLSFVVWSYGAFYTLYSVRTLKLLSDDSTPQLQTWPLLSIIIPACNEGDTLQAALASVLAEDYPNLEIIVINDRSTDATGAIIDALAKKDSRLKPLHITELPHGWLGKVHALGEGTGIASGEWLLFTDADVHFSKGALRMAVTVAVNQNVDHLAVLPRMIARSNWLKIMVCAFGGLFLTSVSASQLKRKNSKKFVGIGAFNLVRKKVLQASAGFSWLRMEVADDVGLGLALKNAGGSTALRLGAEQISVVWYPSAGAMMRGLEKNTYGVMGWYRPAWFVLRFCCLMSLVLLPFVGSITHLLVPLIAHTQVNLWVAAALVVYLLMVTAMAFGAAKRLSFPPFAFYFSLCGIFAILLIALRSAVIATRQGGIKWRGTLYPIAELKAGQRVRL